MEHLDDEHCYRAVRSRDRRFDGVFFTGVRTTGIYCRPSCPARTPLRGNVRFFRTPAAAQAAGLRACRRCRPDSTPGSPAWDTRADLAGRAMRLVNDGVVERDGVPGLARRLGYSERQLGRALVAELGAAPLALARAHRAQTARLLAETTTMPLVEVAQAAGFGSVRQFNDTMRGVYAATPGQLRRQVRSRPAPPSGPLGNGLVELALPVRAPLDSEALLAFLQLRAVPGVEEVRGGCYRRTMRLPHGPAVVELVPGSESVRARLRLHHLADLPVAVERARRLLDLDADPVAIGEALGGDPLLGPLVRAHPGLRVPGHVDGAELAVRAVLGQQVSVASARTLAVRLVAARGEPLAEPDGNLTHLFPTVDTIATLSPGQLPGPASRGRALLRLCAALATGEIDLDRGADRVHTAAALEALPGVGPWTTSYIAMRALGDPDAFLPTDVGVQHALLRLGAPAGRRDVEALARRWRPWRSYALMHLWTSLTEEQA